MKPFHLLVLFLISDSCFAQTDSVKSKDFKWRFEYYGSIGIGTNVTTSVEHWSSDLAKIPSFDPNYGEFSEVNWSNNTNRDHSGFGMSIYRFVPLASERGKSYHAFGINFLQFNGFRGNMSALSEQRFTIDSVTSQSSGQVFPVDSVIRSSWNEEFTSTPTAFGLSYGIDFNRTNNFGFAIKAEYISIRRAFVHSEKLRELTYSVDGYGPEQTIESSEEDYMMDMHSALFRVSFPVYYGFPLNGKLVDYMQPNHTAKKEKLKLAKERASLKNRKPFTPPLPIVSFYISPVYVFGALNTVPISYFDFALGFKFSVTF